MFLSVLLGTKLYKQIVASQEYARDVVRLGLPGIGVRDSARKAAGVPRGDIRQWHASMYVSPCSAGINANSRQWPALTIAGA
jgi:hypothetical protein